ncbi:MAG: ECF transporter S component [Eubacteriales bacterium]
MNVNRTTKYITKVAILTALSVLLIFVLEFPILPAFPYLRFDFSEIPILIGGFALGPAAVVVMEVLKNIIHFFLKNDGTGGVGNLANLIVGLAFCLPAAWYYVKHKSQKSVYIALGIGTLCMLVAGILANLFILFPLFHIVDEEAVKYTLISGIIPFNLIKGTLLSLVVFFVYKPLSPVLHK